MCTVESDLDGRLSPTHTVKSNKKDSQDTKGKFDETKSVEHSGDDDISVNSGLDSVFSLQSPSSRSITADTNNRMSSTTTTRKEVLQKEKLQSAEEIRQQSTFYNQKLKEDEKTYNQKAMQRLEENERSSYSIIIN